MAEIAARWAANEAAAAKLAEERAAIDRDTDAAIVKKRKELEELETLKTRKTLEERERLQNRGNIAAPEERPRVGIQCAWVNRQPASAAASASARARYMSAAAITDVDPNVNPNAELYCSYSNSFKKMQVPLLKVVSAAGIVTIPFSLGTLPVDAEKMWERMGIRPTKKGDNYTVSMTAATASKYGKTPAEIEAAFLAHLALDFSRVARNGNTQTYSVTREFVEYFAPNLELTDEEKKFCTDEGRMLNTYRFMQEYLAKRSGAAPQYTNRSTSGSGGGGAAPTKVNESRSAKTRGPGESGAEFTPTGKLADMINACRPPITGAPPGNPAKYKHMGDALAKHNLGYNRTSGSFSSSNPAVTEEMIEAHLCGVFDLKTTAELADEKRAAAAAEYKAQQAANAAVAPVGKIPDGADSDESDTDESDTDESEDNQTAEQAAGGGSKEEVKILNEPDREGQHTVDGTVVFGVRQDFTDRTKRMIATAAEIDEPGMEKIVDTIGAEYGVYVNGKGVYSLKPDDVHSDERTRKIAKEILAAIAELADQ